MRSWRFILVVTAVIVVMMAPTVASAARFWCVGDPVISVNGVITRVVVNLENDARATLRSEGDPVAVIVSVPEGFDARLVSQGRESFPMTVDFVTGGGDDVTVSVTAPDLAGYEEYSVQLTVHVPSRQWQESSAEATGQSPHADMTVPGNLF